MNWNKKKKVLKMVSPFGGGLFMSQRDLENMGVLLPREQWGKYDLHANMNKPLLLAIVVGTVISIILMYIGNGRLYTWVGAVLFLVMFFGFTFLSIRATNRKWRRVSERKGAR